MPMVATIPVTIQPDAAAFLAEIGMERELEMMIEHAKATIPHLRALDVELHDFPWTGPPSLTIHAHRDPYPGRPDRAWDEFGNWMVEAFSPQVNQNFGLLMVHHDDER
jgi:hypothetical protein